MPTTSTKSQWGVERPAIPQPLRVNCVTELFHSLGWAPKRVLSPAKMSFGFTGELSVLPEECHGIHTGALGDLLDLLGPSHSAS